MPNDAKLGMVIGVGLVILVAVVSAQPGPAGTPSPALVTPSAATKGPAVTPVGRTSAPEAAIPEIFPPK